MLLMLFLPDQQLCDAFIQMFKILAKLFIYPCIEVPDHVADRSTNACEPIFENI